VTHWTLLNGECLISYLYKRYYDPSYIPGKDVETNEFKIKYNLSDKTIKTVVFVQSLLWIISFHLVLKRNQIPLSMSISFASLFATYYLLRFFTKDHYKNEPFLIGQEIIKYALFIYGIILFYILYKRANR
jgi:hypothetical protein